MPGWELGEAKAIKAHQEVFWVDGADARVWEGAWHGVQWACLEKVLELILYRSYAAVNTLRMMQRTE